MKAFIDERILCNRDRLKSKVEVSFSYINFLPYILEDKLQYLRDSDSVKDAFDVRDKTRMNNYKLSSMTK